MQFRISSASDDVRVGGRACQCQHRLHRSYMGVQFRLPTGRCDLRSGGRACQCQHRLHRSYMGVQFRLPTGRCDLRSGGRACQCEHRLHRSCMECNSGYRRSLRPASRLTYRQTRHSTISGHAWTCQHRYVRAGSVCVPR
jgi:hypothetical protein